MNTISFLKHAAVMLAMTAGLAHAQTAVLYSSNNPETVDGALGAVKKKFPKLEVQRVLGGTGAVMKRIQAEGQNPRGDVFWSGGFGTLGAYKNLMEPYQSADLAATPGQFRGPDNLWVGTNVHVLLIMANERQLQAKGLPLPKTWSDLMRPEWKGHFALTDPSVSATAYGLVYGLYKQFGKDGLAKLAANAVVTSSSGATYRGVGNGEYPVGLTLEYIAQQYVAGGQKEIKVIYPSEGSYLAPEGMFIIKGAKNMDAAKALYDGLLSKETQQIMLTEGFRRPTRNDIPISKLTALPDLDSIKIFPLDQQAASAEYGQITALWNQLTGK
jgi:iron(III) transport system substrate-binding protein